MNKKHQIILQVVLALLAFAGSLYVAFTPANSLLNWYNIDDAFFYYKVAQNVLAGNGFTFDGINLSNGFHPLWMVVCLGVFWLSKINLVLPLRVLVVVSGLFNAAAVLVLFRFLKRYLHPSAAWIGALFWGLYPVIFDGVIAHGMESAVSAFLIILLVSRTALYMDRLDKNQVSKKGLFWLGLIGALTILSRLDNLFVVGAVGIFALLKIKRVPLVLVLDLIAGYLAVFLAWIMRLGGEAVVQNVPSIFPMLLVSMLVIPAGLYFGGSFAYSKSINWLKHGLRIALSFAAGIAVVIGILFIFSRVGLMPLFSISILAISVAIQFVLVMAVHLLLRKTLFKGAQKPLALLGGWIKNNWKSTLLGGLSYAAPITVLVGAYMLFNKIVFGSFSPVSGQIKHWWSTLINTVYNRPTNFLAVMGLGNSGGSGPWALLTSKVYEAAEGVAEMVQGLNPDWIFGVFLLLLMGLFIWLMSVEKNRLAEKYHRLFIPALLAGCLIHITYYKATGYTHTRGWYWVAEMITLTAMGSLVLDALCSLLDKTKIKFSSILAFLVTAILIIQHQQYVTRLAPPTVSSEMEEAYLSETRQVEFYTEPGAKIGMTGGGLVGYFIQDRTVVNLDGLINSKEYFDAMKSGTATQFLDNIPLNYVFGKPYMLLESDPYGVILKKRLKEIGAIHGYEDFTLYEYVIKK